MERWEEYVHREYRDAEFRQFEIRKPQGWSSWARAWSWRVAGMVGLVLVLTLWHP